MPLYVDRYSPERWGEYRWQQQGSRIYCREFNAGAATAYGANSALAGIWNPHASISCFVIWAYLGGATTGNFVTSPQLAIIRTSTKGTGSDAASALSATSDYEKEHTPPSGLTFTNTYTVQPTQQGPHLFCWCRGIESANSWETRLPLDGIKVPPSSGLVIVVRNAVTSGNMPHAWTWQE